MAQKPFKIDGVWASTIWNREEFHPTMAISFEHFFVLQVVFALTPRGIELHFSIFLGAQCSGEAHIAAQPSVV